jgi:hypothetical protein
MEDQSGVHVMQLECMDEGSLCGIGCDNPALKNTRKTVVSCPKCIYILKILRTVKYAKQQGKEK